MAVYYNEIDPFAAALLRELMARGLVAEGDVDERSIEDVLPADLVGYDRCHFFAGIGAWDMALRLFGWPDDRPVWTGSCPCQPFSAAGKGAGFADERHLWPAFAWLVRQCRPPVVFGEQVGGTDILPWIDLVSDDLEALGYAVRSLDFPAASVGAPQIRQRLYWCAFADPRVLPVPRGRRLGDADRAGLEGLGGHVPLAAGRPEQGGPVAPAGGASGGLADAHSDGRLAGQGRHSPLGHGEAPAPDRGPDRPCPTDGEWGNCDWLWCRDGVWRPVEPGLVPLVDGTPGRAALLRCIGNAIVPQQAAVFIEVMMEELAT